MEKKYITQQELFVHNLKVVMKERKINRVKLAKDLNIPYTTLCDWCTGRIFPKIEKIEMIANYFNLPTSDFVGMRKLNDIDDDLSNEIARVTIADKIPFDMTPREAVRKYPWFENSIPAELLTHGRYYFGLRIDDDSMAPKFHKNDWAIFYQTDVIDQDAYYCIKYENKNAIIRQIIIVKGGFMVIPLNMTDGLKPEIFKKTDIGSKIYILGRAIQTGVKIVYDEE